MLKRFRIVGLCLVAVFAVSAVVASSASALPDFNPFGVCTDAGAVTGFPTGVWYWSGSSCTSHTAPTAGAFALGTGEYAESPFISKLASGAAKPKLETKAGNTVECETEEDLGEITGPRSERTIVKFTGKCHSTTFGAGECHSSGAPEGTIVTNVLVGKPVYLGAGEKESEGVGIALEPASTEGERLFASFECKTLAGTEHVKVGHAGGAGGDSIVCPITPINTTTTTYTLTCAQTKGVQEHTKYYESGAHTDYLETEGTGPKAFTWEQSGQTTTATITAAATGKIEA